jgi:hypothetical protein
MMRDLSVIDRDGTTRSCCAGGAHDADDVAAIRGRDRAPDRIARYRPVADLDPEARARGCVAIVA